MCPVGKKSGYCLTAVPGDFRSSLELPRYSQRFMDKSHGEKITDLEMVILRCYEAMGSLRLPGVLGKELSSVL